MLELIEQFDVVEAFLETKRFVERSEFVGQVGHETGDVPLPQHRRRRAHQHRARAEAFEVEAEALGHPAVLEAAAIAVPSDVGEDDVLLVVALVEGRTLDPAELLRFLEPRMAHYMLPRYVRVIGAMPKTPTAKIEKHRLRADGLTSDAWDREAHGITVRGGRLHAPERAAAAR